LTALAALLVAAVPIRAFDVSLFHLLNDSHTPATDLLWISFTTLGDGLVLGIVVGCFLLINPRVTFVGIFLMVASGAVIHVVKPLVPVPRPAAFLETIHVVGPLLKSQSFPSGHAAASMSAGLALACFCPSKVRAAALIGIATCIGISRILVGAHFPSDVLGGVVCALAVYVAFHAFIWPRIRDRIPDRPDLSDRWLRIFIYLEILTAVFVLVWYSPRWAEFPPVSAVVSLGVLCFVGIRFREERYAGPNIVGPPDSGRPREWKSFPGAGSMGNMEDC